MLQTGIGRIKIYFMDQTVRSVVMRQHCHEASQQVQNKKQAQGRWVNLKSDGFYDPQLGKAGSNARSMKGLKQDPQSKEKGTTLQE